MLRPETRARARAVQLLYAWEVQRHVPVQELLDGVMQFWTLTPEVAERATRLFRAAANRADEIDSHIAAAAEHWRLERVGAVERTIMRVALAELMAGDTPPKVVIDEAVQLAHWFAGPRSPGFINGVLDGAARALGRL